MGLTQSEALAIQRRLAIEDDSDSYVDEEIALLEKALETGTTSDS